ncbi:hypothetical protein QN277_006158 [Acacia crassicarpa]|uniref:Uncharacterized protein n=1 Tax=Acacia crassicarpa TaxID=499986 RepID=A0AAE1MC05_9FABA|nr:hypothetical protein QN277_006158 [Acacia crassicarpa]
MKNRSRGKAKATNGGGRKRNRDPKRIESSLATAGSLDVVPEVQGHGDTQPSGNGSESLEVSVNRASEMVLQRVEQMRVRVRAIVQSIQMLVAHAQLEYASFRPPTYILSDIDDDIQLIVVQEQGGDPQPLGDGAKPPDLPTGVEDGAARPSLNDRVNRLWDFSKQFEMHLEAFLRWSNQWLLVIATHQNLDLTRIAPSAAEFLRDMENAF